MSTKNQSSLHRVLGDVRQLIFYHGEEIKSLTVRMAVIVVATGIVIHAWHIGWHQGLTWHLMIALAAVLPGPPGVAASLPLSLLVGLSIVFMFDSYKKLQGIFIIGSAWCAVYLASTTFDRFRFDWGDPIVLMFAVVGLTAGLYFGGLFGKVGDGGPYEFKNGFRRLTRVVVGVGLLGSLEAILDFRVFTLTRENPTIIAGQAIPLHWNQSLSVGLDGPLLLAPLYFLSVVVLGVVLNDFTSYEIDKDVLIVGPSRAGKTWLMSGAAYCLMSEAVADSDAADPELNESLRRLKRKFENGRFDEILSNDPGQYDHFELTYTHGLLIRRKISVSTIDYAGELFERIEPDPDEAWEQFENVWGDEENPEMAKLDAGGLNEVEIASLLSVMIAESKTVALVLPLDEFIGDLDTEDLPDFADESQIKSRTNARQPDRSEYLDKYYEILTHHGSETDIFFLGTMADLFIDDFDENPRTRWPQFREHVWEYATLQNSTQNFDPGASQYISTNNPHEYFVPVYFEPDKDDYRTADGNIKPKLNWDDRIQMYSLRGLKDLLRRMGR